MKTTPASLALLGLALSCGIVCLWVCQDIHKPAPETMAPDNDKDPVSQSVHPAICEPKSRGTVGQPRYQTADNATPQTPPQSNPTEDDQAGLAALDQLAQDVTNGRDPGEVLEELTADSSDRLREAAVRLFAGERTASFSGFEGLPPIFVEALWTALRYKADQDGLARSLDAAWRSTSDPVARARLESLENPGLFAVRVAENSAAGDTAGALEYLAKLESCANSGTPNYLAALAGQPGMDLKALCDAAWNWGRRFSGLGDAPDLSGRVSDPAFSAEEQLIAATALAAGVPGPEAYQTLAKAADQQPSADWRAAFEDLRDLAGSTVEPEASQP